jgi:hypothetical protein
MAVLVVLLASLVLFGGLGALGVDALSIPRDVVAWALAAMFAFTRAPTSQGQEETSSPWSRGRSPSLGSR